MKRTVLFVMIFLVVVSISFSGEVIRLATLDWEPYIGQELKNEGYVAEVVKEAFKKEGYEVEYTYLPWARVVHMAKKGDYDGYFPEYYSKEVEEEFIFSEKFKGGPLGFFRKKGSKIEYKELVDLKPYKIGVVRGYIHTPEFDEAEYLKKEEVREDILNIKKLLKGRIDLMAGDKFVGLYTLQKNLPNEMADAMEFIEPPLADMDLYICFSKELTNSKKYNEAFNSGLKKIVEDGTFEEILKRHGF